MQSNELKFIDAKNEFECYQNVLYNAFLQGLAINFKKQPRSSGSLPGKIFYENEQASSDVDKANLFATFFSSVYVQSDNVDDDDKALLSYLHARHDDGFLNIAATLDIVRQVLKRMDISKGVSPDKMSPRLLRECSDILDKPLSVIYSKSLKDMYYPDLWKTGYLTPIYKDGKKSDV